MTLLYLQEKTHIIGMHPNRRLFARAIVDYACKINAYERPKPWRNVGVWEFVGMTGPWSQVLGLYECTDGWDTLTAMIAQTMKTPSAELAATYAAVQNLRSGGYDEILAPLPGSPTYEQLKANNVGGSLLVMDEMRVEPGSEEKYSEALMNDWLPAANAGGHNLVGLFRGALTDGLVLSYWATSLDHYKALMKSSAPETWHRSARRMRRSWRQELWTAAPRSVFSDPEFDYGEKDIRTV
jgi:heme-degrading monooxygenase HmoA